MLYLEKSFQNKDQSLQENMLFQTYRLTWAIPR